MVLIYPGHPIRLTGAPGIGSEVPTTLRRSALVAFTRAAHAVVMKRDRSIVMIDPVTDEVLAECAGPDADGRCPVSERPPYVCAGLRLVTREEGPEGGATFLVTDMQPGRCPLAFRVHASEEV
jgi:hypothetical protein